MTNKDQPLDDQFADIDDLEEPFITDEPPRSAADYVRDSEVGVSDGGKWTRLSGPAVSGEGWTTEAGPDR